VRRSVVLVVVVMATTIWLVAPASGRAAACTWTTAPSVKGNRSLFAVAPLSPSNAWAAGITTSLGTQALIEHWNGKRWSISPTPAMTASGINALAAISATDVWAVGYAGQGPTSAGGVNYRTLVEHWNGATWEVIPSPNPAGTKSNALVGVAAISPTDIWAVGYTLVGSIRQGLTEHWNGSSWTVVASPNPGTLSNGLLDVEATSSTSAVAVGYRSDGYGYETLAERWDGSTWTVVPSPSPGSVDNVLTGLTMNSATDAWAVGYASGGGPYQTLIEHWDGTRWSVVASPNDGVGVNVLRGVSFSSPTNGWAVGTSNLSGYTGYRTLTLHWDGASWTIVPSPNSPGLDNRLAGVEITPGTGEPWAVGRVERSGLIQHCPASSTSGTASPTNPGLGSTPSARTPAGSGARAEDAGVSVSTRGRRLAAHPPTATPSPRTSPQSVVAVDEAAAAGISQVTLTFGAALSDYDRDGETDFVLGTHFSSPAKLYHNDHGSFSEADAGMFALRDRHACAWGDVNRDGLQDLFCAIGADVGSDVKSNELWIQHPDHTFTDEAAKYQVLDPVGRGRRGVFVDANADGYPDLYLGNVYERPDGLPSPNRLLINQGGASFVDAPAYGLDREVNAGCTQAADYNADGFQDLMVCTAFGLKVYRNDGGMGLTDVTASLHLSHNPNDAQMIDVNGDGRLDVLEVLGNLFRVDLQRGSTFPIAYQRALTAGRGVSAGDVNGDGRPDVYVVQGEIAGGQNVADMMLLNDGTGTSFTEMPIPQTTVGAGDDAYALDYDHNGLMDFLVLNGGRVDLPGPVELIAFFPSAPAAGRAGAAR
jgi:FG-GAP-like repeat